uniref:Transporter n=2 Tax=Hirondellea gigas TaxID=1518452 RepID=A0A6A7FV42_9CRUS
MSTVGRLSNSSNNNIKKYTASRRRKTRDHDSISYQHDSGHWGSRVEFLLACLGYSVGVGNLWRFPYLAYENGGAAFLIPYLLLLVVVGRPLYLMEVALGQYSQLGPLHTWKRVTPLMAGLGYSQVVRAALSSTAYMIIISYSIHYLFSSLAYIGQTLPWSTCNDVATADCYVVGEEVPCSRYNLSQPTDAIHCTTAQQSSAAHYWRVDVLNLDPEGMTVFGDMGSVHLPLLLCLAVGWVITCLCLLYGIQSSGKVVYITATFPFLILVVLTVAGLQLPGAMKGLHFLFVPEWSKLLEVNVWRKAVEQVLYSLSVGSGGLITFGSYNDFNTKVHIDVMILAGLDLLASMMCAVTIFSVLGAMAEELGYSDITQVVASGPGLAFIAYPEAISRTLPLPHLWSFLFFLMVFTLGLDSMFGSLESVLTTIFDEYPRTRRHKPVIVATLCGVLFCFGIPYCTEKGQYLFYLMDVFNSGVGSLLFALLSCIALHWVYGLNRFCSDVQFMLGYSPSWFLKATWGVVIPVTLLVLFIGSLLRWEWPLYAGVVSYPSWAYTIGGAAPIIVIAPVVVLFLLHFMDKLWIGRWRDMFLPSSDWAPGCPVARQRLFEQRRLARERQQQQHMTTTSSSSKGGDTGAGAANMAFESTVL